MASDFIGRINNRQEIHGAPESNLPAVPVVRGDPALSRLQRTANDGSAPVRANDGSQMSSEVHHEMQTQQTQTAKSGFPFTRPQVTKALAVGSMLLTCATGAFALGGAGFFLALAAEALAFTTGIMSQNERIKELEEENLRLQEKATQDPLIGINNRGAIDEILRDELMRAPFRQASVSVIMADVDHFKKINDTYGHQVGDEVLIEVAERVYESLRGEDEVGRYGGEEFLMVLPGIGGSQAVLIAHRIRLAIAEEPFYTEGGDLDVTMSLGVCSTDFPEIVGPELLVKAADQALYQAKEQGRNRVVMQMVHQLPGMSKN